VDRDVVFKPHTFYILTVVRHLLRTEMNKIKGQLDKSDHEIYDDFINFRIDDYWLDEKIDELYPGQSYKGLIPTLDFGLYNKKEKEIVWDRILPEKNEVTICPILMCPDDNDFSCTLIVAEIENYGDFVQWKRIGLDETRLRFEDKFGKDIKWFEKLGAFNFEAKDYLETIESFKQQLTKDINNY
jgi:hypothetical protein